VGDEGFGVNDQNTITLVIFTGNQSRTHCSYIIRKQVLQFFSGPL